MNLGKCEWIKLSSEYKSLFDIIWTGISHSKMIKSLFFLLLFALIKIGDLCVGIFQKSRLFFQTYFGRRLRNKKNVKIPKFYFPRHITAHKKTTETFAYSAPSLSIFEKMRLFLKKVFKKLRRRYKRKEKVIRYRTSFFYKFKYVILGFFIAFLFIFLPALFFIFISDLPSPTNLSVGLIPKTTKIYDRNGALLYEIYANQNRTIVKLDQIPGYLKNGTIAIEDRDFYNHPGFDIRGILRALISDLRNSDNLQGGSTITQQLVKSAFLSSEPSVMRKIREVALAFWTERKYTKNQILEMYFNYVPYGGTAWGVESASEIYFGKSVKDLDLAQSAFLAGLPQAPSIYSPYSSASGSLSWKQRQKEVLDAMVRSRFITQQQAREAYDEQLVFRPQQIPLRAPHFVMYVKNLLEQKYGISEVERGGLQVRTSLDLATQDSVQKIVSDEVAQDQYLNITNGAALITNPRNGDILAMVGSRDYFDSARDGNVNLTTALRQPGSTIKVVTYSLALSNGYTEETILEDSPLTIKTDTEIYTPVNYDGKFRGKIPLRLALGNSFNLPPVRLAQKFGVKAIVEQGQKMGISSWKDPSKYGISITLGGADTTMMDLATVFGTIAYGGQRVNPDPILEVKNANGQLLYKKDPAPVRVLDAGVAFIMTDILSDNNNRLIEFGTNTPLILPGKKVAVKTGTTDEKRDNWTIGFTPDILVATWVGNNDNSPMNPALASGITGAAPMWNKIMSAQLSGKADAQFLVPPNIVSKFCNGRVSYFIRGTENSVSCSGQLFSSPSPKP